MNLIFSYNYLRTEENVEDLKYSKPFSSEGDNLFESGVFGYCELDKINFYRIKEVTEALPWKLKNIINTL
jgi:hypothetical protein